MNPITQTKLWEIYINSARKACDRGDIAAAEEILGNALNELGEIIETRKVLLVEAQRELANIYCRQGRFSEAESLYKWALAMAEAHYGRNDTKILPILENLAQSYKLGGQLEDAGRIRARINEISLANKSTAPDGASLRLDATARAC